MTPVMQSKLYCKDGIHNGNCYAACLASMLDIPLWMVPPFEDMFARNEWRMRVEEWLGKIFGLESDVCVPGEIPEEPHLVSGPSARGVNHMVIYAGDKLLHDPHPSGLGVLIVSSRQRLVKMEA